MRQLVMAAAMACVLATAGGCTLIVNLDDYKPGEGLDGEGETVVEVVPAAEALDALVRGTGEWEAPCDKKNGDEEGTEQAYAFQLQDAGDGAYAIAFTQDDVPACGSSANWTETMWGTLTLADGDPLEADALGYGPNAFEVVFTLEGVQLTFLSEDAAEEANKAVRFGKSNWAQGEDVDLIDNPDDPDAADPDVDVSESYEAGDTYRMLLVFDAEDELRLTRPTPVLGDLLLPQPFSSVE